MKRNSLWDEKHHHLNHFSFSPKKQTNIQHTSESRSFLLSHPSPNPSQREALENVKNIGTVVLSFYLMLIILAKFKTICFCLLNTVFLKYQQNPSTLPQNRFLPSICHAFIQQMYHHVLIVIWQIIRHSLLKITCVFKRDTLTHP